MQKCRNNIEPNIEPGLLNKETALRRDKIANAKMCSLILTCLESLCVSIAEIMDIKLWRNLRDSCPVNL